MGMVALGSWFRWTVVVASGALKSTRMMIGEAATALPRAGSPPRLGGSLALPAAAGREPL
jgi:hypothetical protein